MWIEDGIRDYRASGSVQNLTFYLGLTAEALYLADRTSEALEAIEEAEAVAQRNEERHCCAELHRLRGVFLTAIGADEPQMKLRFAKPSEPQRSRSRFCLRNAHRPATQNTVAKKQAGQEDADSDYLFGSFLQLLAFRSRVSVGATRGLIWSTRRFLSWRSKVLGAKPCLRQNWFCRNPLALNYSTSCFDLVTTSSIPPGDFLASNH